MTLTKAVPILNAAPVPLDGRLADMALIACNSDGTPRTGVLGPSTIVFTTASMWVNVAAAEFVTSKGKADGVSIFTNDGTVSVTIAPAPASNSRIDVIWVKHNDDTTGDADALPTFGVTAGTAAASPSKPTIPTGALELATLRIYAGTTATNGGANVLTNTYRMTAMRNAVVRVRDALDLATYTPSNGAKAFAIDTNLEYVYLGGWVLVARAVALTARRAASQSIPDGGAYATLVSWTQVENVDVTFNATTGVATIQKAGLYRIDGFVSFNSGGAATNRGARLTLNGVTDAEAIAYDLIATNQIAALKPWATVRLAVGDTIAFQASQASGGALNTRVAITGWDTRLSVVKIGD